LLLATNVRPLGHNIFMHSTYDQFAFVVGAAVATAIILLLVMLHSRASKRRLARAASAIATVRSERAMAGEVDAEALLSTHGYQVLVRQPRAIWSPRVDGVAVPCDLRADLLVKDEDNDEILIAEVKTGDMAPLLSTAATRRQLLEYQMAFGVAAILLVCPETASVARVDFSHSFSCADSQLGSADASPAVAHTFDGKSTKFAVNATKSAVLATILLGADWFLK
jgi:hypothetical protein